MALIRVSSLPQMLDEVRGAGPHKKGTALAGDTTSDLVVIMKNVPTEANVSNTMQRVSHHLLDTIHTRTLSTYHAH